MTRGNFISATAKKQRGVIPYRDPTPSIPKFKRDDSREFARLRLALDNILPGKAMEEFKYQVFCDRLKLADALAPLIKHYGQPQQLSLQQIAELIEEPTIRAGDTAGFRRFPLRVQALVRMLEQLGEDGCMEL